MRHSLASLVLALLAAAVLALLSAGGARAQSAEEDRGYLQSLLEDALSDAGREVRITGFAGALSSRATITAITIADDEGVWLTLKDLVLDWNRSALLGGRIEVGELSAGEIIVARLPPGSDAPRPEASGFALPDLPVSVQIGRIAAERVVLESPVLGQTAEVSLSGSASLADGEGVAELEIARLDRSSDAMTFRGSYSNETDVLDLSLDLKEGENGLVSTLLDIPGRPSLALEAAGRGPLSDFEAEIALTTDGAERLAGTVRIEGAVAETETDQKGPMQFSARLAGDIAPVFAPAYGAFFGDNISLAVSGARNAQGALSLSELDLETGSLRLSGTLDLDAEGFPQRFDLAGGIASPDGTAVLLPLGGPETTISGADLALKYDRAESDGFRGLIALSDLNREGLTLAEAELAIDGTLVQGDGLPVGEANGAVRLKLAGIAPQNEDFARAIGDTLSGTLTFVWLEGTPLQLPEISLSGVDYGLTGSGSLEGLDDQFDLLARYDLLLTAPDLSRFAGIAGVDLGGGATLRIAGDLAPLGGAFDLTAEGEAQDITIGQPNLDPLIAGTGKLSLAARRDTGGTSIERLALTTPATALTASAELKTGASAARLDLRLRDVAVAVPELTGPAALGLSARQEGDTWHIDADATGPSNARLEVLGALALDGTTPRRFEGRVKASADDLAPFSSLAGRELGGRIDATLEGEANLVNESFKAVARLNGSDLAVGVAEVDRLLAGDSSATLDIARGIDGALRIERAEVRAPRLTLDAQSRTLDDGTTIETRFDARLPDVGEVVEGLEGPATLAGTLLQEGETFSLDARATGPGGADLEIAGSLELGDGAPRRVEGRVTGRAEALAPYAALARRDLGGAVSFDLSGRADLVAQTFDARVEMDGQDLSIGQPVADRLLAGTSRVEIEVLRDAEGAMLIPEARVRTPRLSLDAKGETLPGAGQSKTEFALRLSDLGDVVGGLGGAALASGTLVQDGESWTVQADASGPGEAVAQVIGTARVTGTDLKAVDGTLRLRAASIAPYAVLVGRPLGGGIEMRVEGRADLEAATFDARVDATARNLQTGIAQADQLFVGESRLEADVVRDAAGLVTVRNGSFRSPQLVLSADTTLDADGNSAAQFDGELRDASIFLPGLDGPVTARGTARSAGDRWQVDTRLTGPAGTEADIAGSIGPGARLDLTARGTAPLALADSFIAPRKLSGLARFDLAVNGPPALSSLSGQVTVAGARLTLPRFTLAIGDIDLRADLGGGVARLALEGSVATGGSIRLSGPISLAAPFDANLEGSLNDVGIERGQLFRTTASGNVALRGPLAGGARITGRIEMGEVEVRVPSGGGTESAYIEGLEHVNEPRDVRLTRARAGLLDTGEAPGTDPTPGAAYPLDITINAPARIFVRGRGLDVELGGSLRLTGTTRDAVPIGRFDMIRGRLDILGKRIELTEGYATLQGDFDPFIRLVAETQAGEVTVRVIVEGPAREPEVSFESIPALPEDEVLAQLLFGRPIGEISALQALQLASAVATLAGRGGEGLVGRLRENFGLDDLDVTTNEEGVTEARIGKYISDRVYTDVTADTEGKTEINLNLQINDNFTARGSVASDGETGIGIFFEKNY